MNNEVSNNSNNELNVKSNNNSKLIIVILAVLLIGALGFICYDKFINKEKPPVPTPSTIPEPTNKEETENIELAEWMTYLLKQNITSVSMVDDIRNEDHTVEDLREFLKEFNSHQYSVMKVEGGSGDGLNLRVEYSKNGKDYMIRFQPSSNEINVLFDLPDMADKELMNLINKIPHKSDTSKEEDGNIYIFTSLYGEIKYNIFENAFN